MSNPLFIIKTFHWVYKYDYDFRKGEIIMNVIDKIEKTQLNPNVPEFRVGDLVRVDVKIIEGKRERIQAFEGIVMAIQSGGVSKTFTVRKTSNGIGVEKTWPLHSPTVESVQVVRKGKVRRAKLYYLRGRVGKRAKVKEVVR